MPRQKFNQITLHVGHDKTGSTAIQSALDVNREILQAEGYLYPRGHGHARLGSYFHDEPENYDDNILGGLTDHAELQRLDAEWMEQLLRELDGTSAVNLILSYEGFFTLPEAVWIRIKEFLLRHADNILIVCYCRRPLEYAISAISQRVKTGELPWGRYTGKLAEMRAGNQVRAPDWRLGLPVVFYKYELAKMARIFGKENILLRKYGRAELPGGDVVRDFLSILGVPEPLMKMIAESPERENPSLGSAALQVGTHIIGKLGETMNSAAEFREKIVPLLREIPGAKPGLDEDEEWVIRAATQKELVYLEKEWNIRFTDSETDESKPEKLTEAEVEFLAATVMKRAGFGWLSDA